MKTVREVLAWIDEHIPEEMRDMPLQLEFNIGEGHRVPYRVNELTGIDSVTLDDILVIFVN